MTATASTIQEDITIYEHDTRSDWGNAILAWESGNKRGYQFEDGELRVFKQGWFERLREVDLPMGKAVATMARLSRRLGIEPTVQAASGDAMSFDEQLRVFEHLHAGGFDGDAWSADIRGAGKPRRLKRHRDAAIADGRKRLSAGNLASFIVADAFDECLGVIVDVLGATNLVAKAQLAALEGAAATSTRELVLRVRDLLWGAESYGVRFERFIATVALATGKSPSWQLATALSALVHPDEHVYVRPTAARAQTAWMAPRLRFARQPSASDYTRLCRMIHAVRAELEQAGYTPRDLFDATDFMWTTLRPSARKLLANANPVAIDAKSEAVEAAKEVA